MSWPEGEEWLGSDGLIRCVGWLHELTDEEFAALNARWFHEHREQREDMSESPPR